MFGCLGTCSRALFAILLRHCLLCPTPHRHPLFSHSALAALQTAAHSTPPLQQCQKSSPAQPSRLPPMVSSTAVRSPRLRADYIVFRVSATHRIIDSSVTRILCDISSPFPGLNSLPLLPYRLHLRRVHRVSISSTSRVWLVGHAHHRSLSWTRA